VKAAQQSTKAATMMASQFETNIPVDLTVRAAEAMIVVRDAGTKNER
jgi:hypothetical protein